MIAGARSALRTLLLVATAVAGLAALVPTAQARTAANPVLRVQWQLDGSVTVTMADGTPVGTRSGAPSVIPAGYYTVLMFGPGGCANIPYFTLKGPGENIVENMDGGELSTYSMNAYFSPNSTYAWHSDVDTNVVFTFSTNANVVGTPPPIVGQKGLTASDHGTAASVNPFGGSAMTFQGTLNAAVSPSGKVTLTFKGKHVSRLKVGSYKVAVVDSSATNGLMLQKIKRVLTVSGIKFVGKHTGKVNLTAGRWVVMPRTGGAAVTLVVK